VNVLNCSDESGLGGDAYRTIGSAKAMAEAGRTGSHDYAE
jgi:hypothetical protein